MWDKHYALHAYNQISIGVHKKCNTRSYETKYYNQNKTIGNSYMKSVIQIKLFLDFIRKFEK